MTLAQCEILVAVANTGSLTGAGRALEITQSAVSHALAALETELGVTLLERGRGGARPTEVGGRVVAEARAILIHAEQLRQEAAATIALTKGTLRIGVIASVGTRLLPRLIRRFGARYPGITLALREGTDDEVRDWVLHYEVDLGVVTLPCEGLTTVPLLSDEMVAVVADDHPLAAATSVRFAALAEEPFLLSTGGCEPLIRALFRGAGLVPRVRYTIRDIGTLLAMVEEGLGVTIVPTLSLPSWLSGVRVLPLAPQAERHLALGRRAVASTAPAMATFIAEAQDLVRQGVVGAAPAHLR